MSDALSLLPLALAAGGGTLDGVEAQQWVAAGHALLQRSAVLVRVLSGRRAAVLLPPSGAFLTALAAADGRGAVLINPLASRREVLWQLADARVAAVFTNASLAPLLPPEMPAVLLDQAPRSADVLIAGAAKSVDLGSHFGLPLEGHRGAEGRDEEAVIVYTSAMAGTPLGAILTHRNLLANAHAAADAMGDSSDDHCLAALPFAHLFGLVVCTAAPLLRGARVTAMSRFNAVKVLDLMAQHGITRFMGVPSMFAGLLELIRRRHQGQFREHGLRVCLVGGAPVPLQLQDAWWDATGVELRQGYGLTETAPACLLTRARDANRRGTMGGAVAGIEVSIRDVVTDRAVAMDCEGEICVRGPHVFRGYVSDGERGLLVRNGWLHTGDAGRQHGDGTVSFTRVLKPMFTRNGFNIYPREIETVLRRLPGVEQVHAWGVPHDIKEHDVAVRVVGRVALADVKRYAGRELASYKVPTHYDIVNEGPAAT